MHRDRTETNALSPYHPQAALQPFLKWAGGKRWFVYHHDHLLPRFYKRYIEPFLGGGAVFFSLCPPTAILSDSNRELIETYVAIREDWRSVWRYLLYHQENHSKDHYYACRAKIPQCQFAKAAQLIYLNRACWTGLYRVNLAGIFNVPIGTKDTIVFDTDDFAAVAEVLHSVQLSSCDFEDTIDLASEDDFIFVDPPYTINHAYRFDAQAYQMLNLLRCIRFRPTGIAGRSNHRALG